MTMTNPPPPPASAMGLVAEWKRSAELCGDEYGYGRGHSDAQQQCADELASLLDRPERVVLMRMDDYCELQKPFLVTMSLTDWNIIRQLIARTYGDNP